MPFGFSYNAPRKCSFYFHCVVNCVWCLLACIYIVGWCWFWSTRFFLARWYICFSFFGEMKGVYVSICSFFFASQLHMSMSRYISQNRLFAEAFYLLSAPYTPSLTACVSVVWLDFYCDFVHCIFSHRVSCLRFFPSLMIGWNFLKDLCVWVLSKNVSTDTVA